MISTRLFTTLTKRMFVTGVSIVLLAAFVIFSALNERYPNNKPALVEQILEENAARMKKEILEENVARMKKETPHTLCEKIRPDYTFDEGQQAFRNFNNVTGTDCFIVPNIIHFIRFNKAEYSFIDYVVIMAAMRNHRPDWFYIHTTTPKFTGKYWQKIMDDPDLSKRIRIKPIKVPTEIFGQKISQQWLYYHGGDVARLRVMMEYGGIYLDNDVFVIRNLDKYRKYEIAINWDENQFLGSQVIIANKDARFLSLWLDTYHEYHPDRWYYNAGERPTVEVLYKRPELVHRVKGGFGADTGVSNRLYTVKNYDGWRKLDAIHLLIRHRSYQDPNYKKNPNFTEDNIKTYEYPFGTMVRELLDESPGSPRT